LDDDLYRRLKLRAAEDGRSLKEIVTAALRAALDGPSRREWDWAAYDAFLAGVAEEERSLPPGPKDLSDVKKHLYEMPRRRGKFLVVEPPAGYQE
jgi:plasmid stability protein